jgi:C4-dicarboxylate-specific signal transduction histidine kinase
MVHKDNQVRAHVNLNDVIARVLRLVHSDALERHCVLVTKTDPELPLVEGDQVQLQQVLLNLLVNGFEAMGETPFAERRVIIRSEHESDGRVRMSVRDFGTAYRRKSPSEFSSTSLRQSDKVWGWALLLYDRSSLHTAANWQL